jgi:hypothetical protein
MNVLFFRHCMKVAPPRRRAPTRPRHETEIRYAMYKVFLLLKPFLVPFSSLLLLGFARLGG